MKYASTIILLCLFICSALGQEQPKPINEEVISAIKSFSEGLNTKDKKQLRRILSDRIKVQSTYIKHPNIYDPTRINKKAFINLLANDTSFNKMSKDWSLNRISIRMDRNYEKDICVTIYSAGTFESSSKAISNVWFKRIKNKLRVSAVLPI